MSDDEDHEISYDNETGRIRFYLRRPIYFYAPTSLQEDKDYDPLVETKAPEEDLELEWVYGYRGRDARNNLHKLDSEEVVYFTAAVAVIYNPASHSQRFYTQHTDDIKSIAVHKDGDTIATGQIKGRDDEIDAAHIRIWSASSLETLHVFGMGELARGVNCLSFSYTDDGAQLAAVDDAPEPVLSVWDWQEESKIVSAKCSSDPVLAVTFTREENARIVTTGKNSIVFWTVNGDRFKKKTGSFGRLAKPKYLTAVSHTPAGEVVTGDSNGNIFVWKDGGGEVDRALGKAHDGSVFTIVPREDGEGYYSTGKDMMVKIWDNDFQPAGDSAEMMEDTGPARTLVAMGDRLIAGTTKNALVRGELGGDWKIITQGSLDELWGLAAHPSEPRFLAGSHDKSVTERSTEGRAIMWSIDVENPVQSCTYTPNADMVVVGCDNGEWLVINIEDKETVFKGKCGDEPIQVVRFSPDGSILALGSRDNSVYLYNSEDGQTSYSKRAECEGHSSFIRCLDFSADGKYLQTNSGDYENLFWNIESEDKKLDLVDESDLRDIEWANRTCLLSFRNIGVWPKGVDGTDLNAVAGAHEKELVASADDFGKVKLFKPPLHFAYCANKPYAGHSSHVTAVTFCHGDEHLISLGGNDCSILQWKVISE